MLLFGSRREHNQEKAFPHKPREIFGLPPDDLARKIVHSIRIFEDLDYLLVYFQMSVEFSAH
jgi:hypothetical protein